MGSKVKNLKVEEKMKKCIENGVRDIWVGLYDLWLEYKLFRDDPDKVQELMEDDGVTSHEDKHYGNGNENDI